jgi:uncharacterized membrane protein YvlD (DUF360 family)
MVANLRQRIACSISLRENSVKKRKRFFTRYPAVRILVVWVISALGLFIMSFLLDGLQIDRAASALAAAAVIGLLNALLWPFLSRVLLPFAVFTGGFLFLILNGAVVWLAGQLVDGFLVDSLFWTGIWATIGVTAVNVIFSTLLTIDDDASYYRNVIHKRIRRSKKVVETDVPGVFFLEIDGLARPVLERAMELGYAPTMKRWLEDGSHKLVDWETDLSSQTSASQAGLLHGNNYDIPAFRWYDRQRKKIVASSNPDEVAKIERDHSDGNGLLVDGGASRGNLLSGDAPNVMNTASTIKDFSRFHTSDFYAYFADPYNFTRTLLLLFWDIVLERFRFWQQRRKDVQPRLDRHHRNYKYALVRGGTTVFLRELSIYTLIGDLFAGTPSAYATFVGYDEVAHHSGVETHDAFDALYKIDQQFARLESAAERAPRPYHFVVLSDHGQSGGLTFKQRYGKSLAELVQQLTDDYQVGGYEENTEGISNLNNVLSDALQHEDSNTAKRAAATAKRFAQVRETSEIVKAEVLSADEVKGDQVPGIVVMASGNLGLIYGTNQDKRVSLEEIELVFPGMLDGLVRHEGIGFAMVSSIKHGPVVIGANGRHYLEEERIEGEDPLADFGPRAAQHLIREDSFPNCPDILVNSFYNAESNEVAAFEELIGCHGGMGGYQTQPFVLYPADLSIPDGPLVGAAAVHHVMKGWVAGTNVDKIAGDSDGTSSAAS